MTSQRTNKLFDADIHEGGQYRIVDARNNSGEYLNKRSI
jgi:hypothetical protein